MKSLITRLLIAVFISISVATPSMAGYFSGGGAPSSGGSSSTGSSGVVQLSNGAGGFASSATNGSVTASSEFRITVGGTGSYFFPEGGMSFPTIGDPIVPHTGEVWFNDGDAKWKGYNGSAVGSFTFVPDP